MMNLVLLISLFIVAKNPMAVPLSTTSSHGHTIYPRTDDALFHIQLQNYSRNYGYDKFAPEDLQHGRCAFYDTADFLRENVVRPEELDRFNDQYSADSRFEVTVSAKVPGDCLLAITNRVPNFEVQEYQLFQGCGVGGVELRGLMQESIILREGFYVQMACDQTEIEQLLPIEGLATSDPMPVSSSTTHNRRSIETSSEDIAPGPNTPDQVSAATDIGSQNNDTIYTNFTFDPLSTKLKSHSCNNNVARRNSQKCPQQPYDGPLTQDFCTQNSHHLYDWQEFFGEWDGSKFPGKDLPGEKLKVSSLQSCVSTVGCSITGSSSGTVSDSISSSVSTSKTINAGFSFGFKPLANFFNFAASWSKTWTTGTSHGVGMTTGWTNADGLKTGQQGFLECQTSVNLHRYVRCNKGQIDEELRLQHQLDSAGLSACFINLVLEP